MGNKPADWWNIPPPTPGAAGVGTPCAKCGHGNGAHDYSDISKDFAECVVPGCKCEDWEEPDDELPVDKVFDCDGYDRLRDEGRLGK